MKTYTGRYSWSTSGAEPDIIRSRFEISGVVYGVRAVKVLRTVKVTVVPVRRRFDTFDIYAMRAETKWEIIRTGNLSDVPLEFLPVILEGMMMITGMWKDLQIHSLFTDC